jgi:hypothetical protein
LAPFRGTGQRLLYKFSQRRDARPDREMLG